MEQEAAAMEACLWARQVAVLVPVPVPVLVAPPQAEAARPAVARWRPSWSS